MLVGICQGRPRQWYKAVPLKSDEIKIGEFFEQAYRVGFLSDYLTIDESDQAFVDPGLVQIGGFDVL
jgi:hypothetical protein